MISSKVIKHRAKHYVQDACPVLWRLWLDFRHGIRVFHYRAADRKRLTDRLHVEIAWDFADEHHKQRNEMVLRALQQNADLELLSALEIGCSEGVLTTELAKHFRHVRAVDVSSVACSRAQQRCASWNNVTVQQLDMAKDEIHNRYDVIFVMDVLCFLHGRDLLLTVFSRLQSALLAGGFLVVTDCRMPEQQRSAWWQKRYPFGADAYIEILNDMPGLKLIWTEIQDGHEEGYPSHRIGIFRAVPE